jgi:hypothetical protein
MRVGRFRVVIYTNDHPPAHVHVWAADGEVRIQLGNRPAAARIVLRNGMNVPEAHAALRVVVEHWDELGKAWEEIHGC